MTEDDGLVSMIQSSHSLWTTAQCEKYPARSSYTVQVFTALKLQQILVYMLEGQYSWLCFLGGRCGQFWIQNDNSLIVIVCISLLVALNFTGTHWIIILINLNVSCMWRVWHSHCYLLMTPTLRYIRTGPTCNLVSKSLPLVERHGTHFVYAWKIL